MLQYRLKIGRNEFVSMQSLYKIMYYAKLQYKRYRRYYSKGGLACKIIFLQMKGAESYEDFIHIYSKL